jgi:hypothetical protein
MRIEQDDPAFRRWVSSLDCCIPGCKTPGIHPHHVKLKSQGGKDPMNVIPICWKHHTECHDNKQGMIMFFIDHNIDPFIIAGDVTGLYESITDAFGYGCPL